jgi:hypothetical protein
MKGTVYSTKCSQVEWTVPSVNQNYSYLHMNVKHSLFTLFNKSMSSDWFAHRQVYWSTCKLDMHAAGISTNNSMTCDQQPTNQVTGICAGVA